MTTIESLLTTRKTLRLELKDLLRPCDHNFIPQNLSGTCEWIWTHPIFSRWLTVKSTDPRELPARMMCIYGTKGCGKSVLAASIVEHFKAEGKIAVLFSFWAGRESQRKLTDFLRTLLWHLLQRISDDDAQKIYTPLIMSLPFNQHDLSNAIKKAGLLIPSRIYCVLDAIDESADDWSQPKSGSLKYVLELLQAMPNFRLILIGREPAMQAAKALTALNVEITEDTIRHDIHKFIDVELDRSLKVRTPTIRQYVRQCFQEKSTTMFLWVSLVFTELNRCYLESEIRQTLEHMPHNLDREYHRLFVQLIEKFQGSSARPSISMRRTKCLLSLIIAAPEPLTYDELRHAFALCQHPQSGFEEYLIGLEGIIDSVGDFVRISDGHFHISHASLTEFLTRDLVEWEGEDESIIFFRINVIEAHTSMCLACFDYLLQSDLGYPMTDNLEETLPERFPFFEYASKEIPNHVTEIYAIGLGTGIESKILEFVKSTKFCAFIEYLSLCFRHDEWTISHGYAIHWFRFILSEDEEIKKKPPLLLPNLSHLFEKELQRREVEFGLDHARCHSWRSLMMTLGSWVGELHQMFDISLADENENTNSHTTEHATHEIILEVTRSPISDIPQHIATDQYIPLKRMNRLVYRILQHVYRVPSTLSVLSADTLPIPFLLLWSTQVSELAHKISLVHVALKRLRGQMGFTESLCLFYMGDLLEQQDRMAESIEKLYQSSLEIANSLRSLPHVEWLIISILTNLASYLNYHGRQAESHRVLQQLNKRLLGTGSPTFKALPGRIWDIFKTMTLYQMTVCHERNGNYEAVCYLSSVILAKQKKAEGSAVNLPHVLQLKADSLYSMRDYKASECIYRDMLCSLDVLDRNQQLNMRWYGLSRVSHCLYKDKKDSEALRWIQQISLREPPNEPSNNEAFISIWRIGGVSAALGNFDLAGEFFEKALTARGIFQETTIEPRIVHLGCLAEALEVHRPTFKVKEGVMNCCRLRAAWTEDVDYLDDHIWWRDFSNDIRTGASCFHLDAWDIIYLKCIDICLPKFGIHSGEILELYQKLIELYEEDGEPEAARIVLEDCVTRLN